MTVTAEGSATTVDVGSDLVLTATPDVAFDPQFFAITWSSGDSEVATVDPEEGSTTTMTGVSADSALIIAELKKVTYVNGVRTLISFDEPISDSIEITVETGT